MDEREAAPYLTIRSRFMRDGRPFGCSVQTLIDPKERAPPLLVTHTASIVKRRTPNVPCIIRSTPRTLQEGYQTYQGQIAFPLYDYPECPGQPSMSVSSYGTA